MDYVYTGTSLTSLIDSKTINGYSYLDLKIGDKLCFKSDLSHSHQFDLSGYKVKIDLYGKSTRYITDFSTSSSMYSGGDYAGKGAHISAILDLTNKKIRELVGTSDGLFGGFRVGSNYGAYISLHIEYEDDDGDIVSTNVPNSRFLVAGDAGEVSNCYLPDQSGKQLSSAHNASLFTNQYADSMYSGNNGTQTSGGAVVSGYYTNNGNAGTFGTGGAGITKSFSSYYFTTGKGGNGWYGGSSSGGTYKTNGYGWEYGPAGGGSSYALTKDSYKPNGYFYHSNISADDFSELISDINAEIMEENREYYAVITILDFSVGSLRAGSVECYYDRNTANTTRPYGEFFLPTLDDLKTSLASKLNVNKSNITKLSIDTVDFTIAKGTSSSYPYAVIATSKTLKYTNVAYNTTTNTTSTLRGISNSELFALNPTDISWDNISNNRTVLKIYSSSSLSGTFNNSNTQYWRVYDAGDSIKTTFTVYLTYTLSDGTVSHSTIKYYDGSEWKDCEVFYYNGSEWKQCDVFQYDGSEYKKIGG